MMLKGKKTLIFNLLLSIFGVLETFDFTNYMTEDNATGVIGIIALINIVLRYKTTTPIGKNDD